LLLLPLRLLLLLLLLLTQLPCGNEPRARECIQGGLVQNVEDDVEGIPGSQAVTRVTPGVCYMTPQAAVYQQAATDAMAGTIRAWQCSGSEAQTQLR